MWYKRLFFFQFDVYINQKFNKRERFTFYSLAWYLLFTLLSSNSLMGSRGRDCMVVGFTISVQSVPITTNVVSSNLLHGEVFSIQHYVIKIVSELQQVGCFLWVLRFPPPIKSITTKKWNVVESDDKHHKPNQAYCLHCFPRIRWNISTTMSFGDWYTIKCPQIGKSQMFLKKMKPTRI
jgi:hypothetical protein